MKLGVDLNNPRIAQQKTIPRGEDHLQVCEYTKAEPPACRLIDRNIFLIHTENVTPETQKRILDAFEIFDHDHNKTVDAREIGTIIRFLGQSLIFTSRRELNTLNSADIL